MFTSWSLASSEQVMDSSLLQLLLVWKQYYVSREWSRKVTWSGLQTMSWELWNVEGRSGSSLPLILFTVLHCFRIFISYILATLQITYSQPWRCSDLVCCVVLLLVSVWFFSLQLLKTMKAEIKWHEVVYVGFTCITRCSLCCLTASKHIPFSHQALRFWGPWF